MYLTNAMKNLIRNKRAEYLDCCHYAGNHHLEYYNADNQPCKQLNLLSNSSSDTLVGFGTDRAILNGKVRKIK